MNANLAETQYNLSKWHKIIKECTSSDIGIIQWLKENNISKDQYYYWRRKLKDACIESIQPAFVEMPVPISQTAPSVITKESKSPNVSAATIRYKDICIEINESASPQFIGRLIEVLKYAE